MPKPGAMLPTVGVPHALTADANDPVAGNSAFRIAVATEGHLMARYKHSAVDVELHYPTAGVVVFEPGSFSQVWKPAAGAVVTLPADTIILLNS